MIEVEGLTKLYGEFTAVSDLSFGVGPGEVMGLVGPNGAGKTSTLRHRNHQLEPPVQDATSSPVSTVAGIEAAALTPRPGAVIFRSERLRPKRRACRPREE